MKDPAEAAVVARRKQFNLRVDAALIKATKMLALSVDKQPNEMMEEALRDLLKKYKGKG